MTDLQIGSRFLTEGTHYTIAHIHETQRGNVALLICEDIGCPYITVRDLSRRSGMSGYDWAWGHYFRVFEDAVRDYLARKADLEKQGGENGRFQYFRNGG